MTTQLTCKQRIKAHWSGRKDDFDLFMKDEEGTKDTGPFNEYGLCFDYVSAGTFKDQRRGFHRYQLSTGGPGDEIRFYSDAAGKVYKAEYWFLDWFDGAHINVTEEP